MNQSVQQSVVFSTFTTSTKSQNISKRNLEPINSHSPFPFPQLSVSIDLWICLFKIFHIDGVRGETNNLVDRTPELI